MRRPVAVKYRCKKCGYAEKFKGWELLLTSFGNATIIALCLMGALFILILSLVGIDPILQSITSSSYDAVNRAEDAQLRAIAVNWTRMCSGDDVDCYAREIYQHMAGIRYVPDSINGNHTYSPLTVLRDGGDCKSTSNTFRALLNSVGIRASIATNLDHRHAVAIVPRYRWGQRIDGFYVIDLTMPAAFYLEDGQDVWTYLDDEAIEVLW